MPLAHIISSSNGQIVSRQFSPFKCETMSLQESLKFTHRIRFWLAVSPFQFNFKTGKVLPDSSSISAWTIISLVTTLGSVFYGTYLMYLANMNQSTKEMTEIEKNLFGTDSNSVSVTAIIIQMNMISNLFTYVAIVLSSYNQRKHLAKYLQTILHLYQVLEKDFHLPTNQRRFIFFSNLYTGLILFYNFAFLLIFNIVFGNAKDSYFLVPFSFVIQSLTFSASLFDFLVAIALLTGVFELLSKATDSEKASKYYLQLYSQSLDLVEVVSQNHGSRELYNCANEFLALVTQTVFVFYLFADPKGNLFYKICFGLVCVPPQITKIFTLSYVGSRLTNAVRS